MNDPRRNSLKLLAAFVAIYVVWGTTYLAIKYAVETIPPFLMMGMRSLSAGTVLYTWGRLRGDANVTRRQLPSLVIIGVLFFLVGHGVLAWAQQTVPSGVAALLIASEPIVIALFEPLFTKEGSVDRRTLVGMLMGISGIALLVVPQGFDVEHANLLGSVGILIGTCSWAGGAIYARIAKLPRSPLITGGVQLLAGGVSLMIASAVSGEWTAFSLSHVAARSWLGLLYLVLFGSIITFSAYTWLLSVTSATRISTHTFVNPLVAIAVGWALGGETISSEMVVAALLIILAVYLVVFRNSSSSNDRVNEAARDGTVGEP